MTRVTANGYFDAEDSEQVRFEKRKALNTQRTEDYKNGAYALAGGVRVLRRHLPEGEFDDGRACFVYRAPHRLMLPQPQ